MYWLLKMRYHSCPPSPDTQEQIAREPPKKCNTANQEKNGSRPHYCQQGQSCITNCVDMQRSLTRISTFRIRKVHRQNCLQQLRIFDLSDIIIYLLVSCTVLCCACSDAQPTAFTPDLLAHAHSWPKLAQTCITFVIVEYVSRAPCGQPLNLKSGSETRPWSWQLIAFLSQLSTQIAFVLHFHLGINSSSISICKLPNNKNNLQTRLRYHIWCHLLADHMTKIVLQFYKHNLLICTE